jgi:hypothetical protein
MPPRRQSLRTPRMRPPNGLKLRAAPRACEGQLPGGPGTVTHMIAEPGGLARGTAGSRPDKRRSPPNGLEFSYPAVRPTVNPFSRNLAGKSCSNLPPASRVSRRSWCFPRAPGRGSVKTPDSPIAFPLRPQEPGEDTRIAPTSCFPQRHSWGWRPTGPSFHTVWQGDRLLTGTILQVTAGLIAPPEHVIQPSKLYRVYLEKLISDPPMEIHHGVLVRLDSIRELDIVGRSVEVFQRRSWPGRPTQRSHQPPPGTPGCR